MMRVIGGKYRGRVLGDFSEIGVRPTSDRGREALFNIFQNEIAGSTFYDGFCGSGAVGIEAISRGAKRVVFTDNSIDSINLCKQNLKKLGESGEVIFCKALDYLSKIKDKFDFIFLDPPYDSQEGERVLEYIDQNKLLNTNGYVIFEKDCEIKISTQNLTFISCRKYGKNHFNIYKLQG